MINVGRDRSSKWSLVIEQAFFFSLLSEDFQEFFVKKFDLFDQFSLRLFTHNEYFGFFVNFVDFRFENNWHFLLIFVSLIFLLNFRKGSPFITRTEI